MYLYPPGGIWTCERDGDNTNTPTAWDNLITNTTKYVMTFSDYTAIPDTPQYMTRAALSDYYKSYADHFKLNDHIQYNTRVIKVRKTPDYDSTGRWEVFTCPTSAFHGGDKSPGLDVSQEDLHRCVKEVFDVVLVCSGFFKAPRYPDIPGLDSFPGVVNHSFHYKSGVPFEGKKVMVVGNSFSAGDIAVDISLHTDKAVELSLGKGTWIWPRVVDGGWGADRDFTRSLLYWGSEENTNDKLIANCQKRIDHIGSGINPQLPPTKAPYMMGDDIYLKILTDRIRVKDQLVGFNGSTAEFKGGSKCKDVEAVIFATGYAADASFVDIEFVLDEGRMELYHMMLPLREKHHSLAFIGFLAGDGPVAPPTELQARYIARLITGKIAPPSKEAMAKNVETLGQLSLARKGKYTYHLPLFLMSDLVATDLAVYPSFWRVLLRDPVLSYRIWFGPMFSAQYRLLGPDSDWDTARAACYRAHEVVTANASSRGPVKVMRDDIPAIRRKHLIFMIFGISLVATVGFVGTSRGWFDVWPQRAWKLFQGCADLS